MTRRINPFGRQRFLRALRYFVVGRASQAVASVALILLTVRALTPVEYGTYMVLWGFIELARSLTSLGLLPALQQFLPEMALHATQARLKRVVRVMTLTRFALLTLFAVILYLWWLPLTAWLQFEPRHADLAVLACALIVCVQVTNYTDHALEALLEQRFAQVVRALLPLFRLAGLTYLVTIDEVSLRSLLVVDLAGSFVCLLLAEWALARRLRTFHPDGSRAFPWRDMLRFVADMSVVQLLQTFANPGLLRIVAVQVLGLEAAGQFAFLQQLYNQVRRYLPTLLLANLVRPVLVARHVSGEHAAVETGAGLLWKSNAALVWPVAAAMFLIGDWCVAALSGGRFTTAGLALGFMLLAAAANAQLQITAMMLQVYRYTGVARNASFLALLVPLAVWVGAGMDVVGAAAGLALAMWLRSAVSLSSLRRQAHRIALDWPGAARLFAAMVLASLLIAALLHLGLPPLWAGVGFVLTYLLSAVLLRPLHRNEFDLLVKVLGRRAEPLRHLVRS